MSNVENIEIRQNWIEEQVDDHAKDLNIPLDDAFMFFVASLILDISPNEIDPGDIVDGGQDKQIDFIHIEDNQDKGYADITIIQSKNKKSFSSNVVIQLKSGLDWVFEKPKSDVNKISNIALKNKISEIRQLRLNYGATNINISVYHITIGDKSKLSDEYLQESKTLTDKYATLGFDGFYFDQLGAHEIIQIQNEAERLRKKVDLDIPIIYDSNRASIMEFSQGDTKSFVCTLAGETVAVITSVEPRDSIFDLNVRPYYGSAGKVNRDIWKTCTTDESQRFWFLNNGITMLCDSFDFSRDPDNPILKVKNAQIVNGCQTSVTLREAYEKKELQPKVQVLLRLYSTDNPNLVDKITLTTNNQNRITNRDLRANDSIQRDIELMMYDKYGYFYERKNKQHRNLSPSNKHKIVPSPKAAQAYLAVVRRKPSNARGYIGAIWSDFYKEIFENASVADLLLSFKIYSFCYKKSLTAKHDTSISALEREMSVYGIFHISLVMGYKLTNGKWGNANIDNIEEQVKQFDSNKKIDTCYKDSTAIVIEQRKKDLVDAPIAAMYFKAGKSQNALNAILSNEIQG